MQTSQSRAHIPATSFIGHSHSGPLSSCPNHPRVKCQMRSRQPLHLGASEVIQTRQPNPLHPAILTLFLQKPQESFLCTPSLLLPMADPGASLHAPHHGGAGGRCTPLWGTVTNHLFNDNCLLICWPYYTSDFPFFETLGFSKVLLLDLSLMLIPHASTDPI